MCATCLHCIALVSLFGWKPLATFRVFKMCWNLLMWCALSVCIKLFVISVTVTYFTSTMQYVCQDRLRTEMQDILVKHILHLVVEFNLWKWRTEGNACHITSAGWRQMRLRWCFSSQHLILFHCLSHSLSLSLSSLSCCAVFPCGSYTPRLTAFLPLFSPPPENCLHGLTWPGHYRAPGRWVLLLTQNVARITWNE